MEDKFTAEEFQEAVDQIINAYSKYGIIPSKITVSQRYKEELMEDLQSVMEIKEPFTYKGIPVVFNPLPEDQTISVQSDGWWEFPE